MARVTSIADRMNRVREKRGETPEDREYENASRSRRTIPVPLDDILVEDRLRAIDPAAVEHLAESIDRQGLQSPILVRQADDGGYVLVAGAHRIAAARALGWTRIEAFEVKDLPEDEFIFLEIDENFCRAELDWLDRSRFMAKRKEIYQRLYPETRAGGDRKSLEYKDNIKSPPWAFDPDAENRPESFSDHTAARTPFSASTIKRATYIGENILPELQDALAETPIRKRQNDLETIAGMKPDKQQDLLQRLQTASQPPPSLSALMADPHRPSSPRKTNLDRLTALWSKTSASHRRQFLEYLWNDASEAERDEFREWLAEPGTQP